MIELKDYQKSAVRQLPTAALPERGAELWLCIYQPQRRQGGDRERRYELHLHALRQEA